MNTMYYKNTRIFTTLVFAQLLALIFVSAPLANDDSEDSSSFNNLPIELTARIMSVDLNNDIMVVAEKDILLRSGIEGGEKRWITSFSDQTGQPVQPAEFKVRDLVRVEGFTKGEMKISAYTITLLSSSKEKIE